MSGGTGDMFRLGPASLRSDRDVGTGGSEAGGLAGLRAGGTGDALVGPPETVRRRRVVGAGASAGLHALLFLVFASGLVDLPEALPPSSDETARPDPLVYAFEAPPVSPEPEAVVAVAPPEPQPAQEPVEQPPSPPAPPLLIPRAQIATPNTGFQNDLPFSEGDSEEFYSDERQGAESGEGEARIPVAAEPDEPDEADIAEAIRAAAEAAASEADFFEGTQRPEPEPEPGPGEEPAFTEEPDFGNGSDAIVGDLMFDPDAFRRRINDPASDVRRRGEESARARARARLDRPEAAPGEPTDIWRFLDGKKFRNLEGGLVANRNNTLYYDDRGANLVPWIGRLIAEVRRNWYIPYAASYESGHVAIALGVLRSGQIEWMQIVVPSGVPGFDNAAAGAIQSARLLPLPDDYPGRDFEIMLVFWYNEQPYDLFGGS